MDKMAAERGVPTRQESTRLVHRPRACALSPAPLPVTCDACATDPKAGGKGDGGLPCEPPASVAASDFSLDTYTSARWFVQESVPRYQRYTGRCVVCPVRALRGTHRPRVHYQVINHEEDATGLTIPAPALCAIQDAASKSKLTVGICMLPIPAATNYHVLSTTRPRALLWSRKKSEQPPPFAQDAHVTTVPRCCM